jgi:hypothetical protein
VDGVAVQKLELSRMLVRCSGKVRVGWRTLGRGSRARGCRGRCRGCKGKLPLSVFLVINDNPYGLMFSLRFL